MSVMLSANYFEGFYDQTHANTYKQRDHKRHDQNMEKNVQCLKQMLLNKVLFFVLFNTVTRLSISEVV